MSKSMSTPIKLEEWGQFLLSIVLFAQLDYAWWLFPALILAPDISMLGYVINTKVGAWSYNLFHFKLVAIAVLAIGLSLDNSLLQLAGIILFGHSAMDRAFGYGLNYNDDFKHTHLGWIGRKE